ncbi:hypothetical protein Aab01nite_65760 [Paractinoplanes abujensis]|uniref:Uncharacterized protein n=1 Tax=Paractinoplanes abujensis TaxID=882441 RepID=A0A7W7CPU1_9ACTN|nr:hypothetical protein [Actinoplanes abujensis]MBB4692517.1 hypothetical protein [Actinoplanes abujensis]GID22986.1 hypothetical protein Aab01nite_65760 [Actinoplanes abujensis]
MRRVKRWALPATAILVATAVLAPLAAPGYVLSYDMVFVPHQPLRADLIVPSATLPRAVPQDALVSLASVIAPGWLVQRVALVAILLLAALGAGRLVPTERLAPRLIAAVAYAWTPLLAERLLLGQWGLLLAYGSLPWIVTACLRDRGSLWRLLAACAPAAVTPTGGLIAFAGVLVLAPRKAWLPALLNAPWLLATALSSADGRSDPGGVAAFAARGADWTGPIGALLGTGGVWNAQTTLPSRTSPLAPVGTLLLLALAVLGWRLLRDRLPGGAAVRLLILAGGGFLLAALAVLPGGRALLEWAVTEVPGAGVLRDGQKFLIPYALVLCLGVALGAERTGRREVLAGALLLPLVVMPDLAYGALGRLVPVQYPADFEVVARTIERSPGEVVSLPFRGYHTYSWNRSRTVIDPLPRYVDAEVVRDDRLLVGDQVIAGENRRADEIRTALALGKPLAPLGMRWVVVQRVDGEPPVPPGALAGLRMVHAGTDLQLYENGSSQRSY